MATRRTERLVKRVLLWAAAGVLCVIAVSLALSTWRVYSKLSEAREGRQYAEEERDQLKERTTELMASVEALKTSRGIEDEIRTRYPVVKPGEVEIVLVDKTPNATTTSADAQAGLWQKIRSWLGL